MAKPEFDYYDIQVTFRDGEIIHHKVIDLDWVNFKVVGWLSIVMTPGEIGFAYPVDTIKEVQLRGMRDS